MHIEHTALIVDDYDEAVERMRHHGVEFVDVAGNRWDLLGPLHRRVDATTRPRRSR